MEITTRSSQQLNLDNGLTFWVDCASTHWPKMSRDLFALEGHSCNRGYIVPSLDLVVARIGNGLARWDEPAFIGAVAPVSDHRRRWRRTGERGESYAGAAWRARETIEHTTLVCIDLDCMCNFHMVQKRILYGEVAFCMGAI